MMTNTNPSENTPTTSSHTVQTSQRRNSCLKLLLLILIILMAALSAAAWYGWQQLQQNKPDFAAFEQQYADLQRRVDTLETQLRTTQQQFQKTQRSIQTQQVQAQRLNEQIAALQLLARAPTPTPSPVSFARNAHDLADELEHMLNYADQTLRLYQHIPPAINALEAAQTRLLKANDAHFAPVLQAINADLEQLKHTPHIDIAELTQRLDTLDRLIDTLPLLAPVEASASTIHPNLPQPLESESNASTAAATTAPENLTWWQRTRHTAQIWLTHARHTLVKSLTTLIQIQRIEQPDAMLLTPEQAHILRQNLHQQLLLAKWAALMQQTDLWQREITAVNRALTQYFNPEQPAVAQARAQAQTLAQTSIPMPLPHLAQSLQALELVRNQLTEPTPSSETE